MATQQVTIDLPEAIVQQLMRLAEVTRQPIESLVTQSVVSNLPPMMETASPELQRELLNLQTLSIEDLLTIANSQIDSAMHQHHVELLDKHQQGTLSEADQKTLMEYQDLCDRLMLRKAYAWSVLRWRGHTIPAIKDLAVVGETNGDFRTVTRTDYDRCRLSL